MRPVEEETDVTPLRPRQHRRLPASTRRWVSESGRAAPGQPYACLVPPCDRSEPEGSADEKVLGVTGVLTRTQRKHPKCVGIDKLAKTVHPPRRWQHERRIAVKRVAVRSVQRSAPGLKN